MDNAQAMAEIRDALRSLDALSPEDTGTGTTLTLATGQSIEISPFDEGPGLDMRVGAGQNAKIAPCFEPGYKSDSTVGVVIADRIPKALRTMLREAGWSWLDRRGHINLRHGPVLIDADIDPIPRVPAALRVVDPFAGQVALAVALIALERHPEPLEGVRATARTIGCAPTTASNAMARLVNAGLLGRDHRAIVPELFWALTDRWHTPADGLASVPEEPFPGAVLVGAHAAAQLGAPSVTTSDYPAELLVADAATARRIIREYGATTHDDAPARLSIAVTPIAATPTDKSFRGIPIAHPVVVALGVATDRGRGAEIVNAWEHPARVW